MTKPAAGNWQDYDLKKPPSDGALIIVQSDTYYCAEYTSYKVVWREKFQDTKSWAYINTPEPELLPCALHPDLKPIRTGATAEGVGCRDPHCCTMSNFELWNEMQEWLKGKTK